MTLLATVNKNLFDTRCRTCKKILKEGDVIQLLRSSGVAHSKCLSKGSTKWD